MSVITGEALALVRDLQDSQVVDLCMDVLKKLFQEQVNDRMIPHTHCSD